MKRFLMSIVILSLLISCDEYITDSQNIDQMNSALSMMLLSRSTNIPHHNPEPEVVVEDDSVISNADSSYTPSEYLLFRSNRTGNYKHHVANSDNVVSLFMDPGAAVEPGDYKNNTFVYLSNHEGTFDLYSGTFNVSSFTISNLVRLTNDSYIESDISLSYDGSKVTYMKNNALHITSTDGSTTETVFSTNEKFPRFTPDGKIVYTRYDTSQLEVWVMDQEGSNRSVLISNGSYRNYSGMVSPDGTKIIYVSEKDSLRGEIYVANIDGSNQIRLTNNDDSDSIPRWNSDGTKIVWTHCPNAQFCAEKEVMKADVTDIGLTNIINVSNDNVAYDNYARFISF